MDQLITFNSYSALVALALVLALAAFSKLLKTPKKGKFRLPPGPKPWPIIGNVNLLGQNKHLSLHRLAQKYGGIMQLKMFTSPVVVVSSPEMVKELLKTHDKVSASRPPFAAGKYTNYDYSNILWAPLGPDWQQGRRIFKSEMLTPSKLTFYEHIRIEEIRNFLSGIHDLSGKVPVLIRDHAARIPLRVMVRTLFGDRHFRKVNLDVLQGLLDEWLYLNGAFCIGDWVPWLKFVDEQGSVKKMKAYKKKFDKFIDGMIDDHLADRAASDRFVPQDVLDFLLQLPHDPELECELTRDCIKAIVQDALTGGTDTTTCAIEWAVHEICKQPRIIGKAKEELDSVVGRNRWVVEKDLSELPYISSMIMETLRLHPPATLIPPHMTTADCNLLGYDVPKGTTIFVNAWSVGRDPKTWDAPDEFKPERFSGKEIDLANNFTLLPFGTGRRMCPAYKYGFNNVRLILANLLHGFHWKLPDGMKPEDVCLEEQYQLTTHPKVPISIIFEPTLTLSV